MVEEFYWGGGGGLYYNEVNYSLIMHYNSRYIFLSVLIFFPM